MSGPVLKDVTGRTSHAPGVVTPSTAAVGQSSYSPLSLLPPETALEVLLRLLDEIDEYVSWVKVGISDLIASA